MISSLAFLPTLTFGSLYIYSPSGASAASRRSRLLCALLKEGNPRLLGKYAAHVCQQSRDDAKLSSFLGRGEVLVPIPGSAPTGSGCSMVAQQLAQALVDAGVGEAVWPGVRRRCRVRRSATAPPGARPTVDAHYDSFDIDREGLPAPRLMLVDDVVTKGRTLLAAAMRLHEVYPRAEIRAFALLRTLGYAAGVERLLDPCVGEIRWRAGDAWRSP